MTNLSALYTDKQIDILKVTERRDWFMLINHGAKRTGKTILNNDLFLRELIRVRKVADDEGVETPQYILAGATLGTIQKNVLIELTNKYGIEFKFDKYNSFNLFGVQVVQTGHSKVSGIGAIRGMTAYGAYINEASLAHEEVFDEIKSRCSGSGARIIVDTNPDHPEHWLLKDYIENKEPKAGILEFSFQLDDNTFLNERYKESIKASTPSGMFYERNINGQWVSGDGVVYSDFDLELNTVTEEELNDIPMKEYFAGVDWGYEHYGSIIVIGRSIKGDFYLIEEHAHQFKFIDDWVEIAKGIVERYGNINFYCDTARPEYVTEFRKHRLRAINADKSVMSGIENVAKLFKQRKLKVVYEQMDRFKQEIYKYVWHPTKGEPIKEFDDVMDSLRYAIYTHLKPERLRRAT
ncbi:MULTISPECIES: PBSX family phage terminase large subunit [Mammaliicoccus]|uniref:PBSX family phage terminase large subunit n=1 Tax=Mammaliicoccus sciuri TaxID=1296 RepID=A0AAW5LQJ1_MAMSC|nr:MULTISPECIES: PBSX family phage terminase large subunit [Mammaliicoccus]MCQ9304996.1 PBSX family phage terminase large subunit [Mammaliicoccus sciuri]